MMNWVFELESFNNSSKTTKGSRDFDADAYEKHKERKRREESQEGESGGEEGGRCLGSSSRSDTAPNDGGR